MISIICGLISFDSQLKENKFLYLLDSVFSVFVIGTLVILVWRGMWCILDRLIFPQNLERSGWISLVSYDFP